VYTFVVPALGRLRQQNGHFEVSQDNIADLISKNKKKKEKEPTNVFNLMYPERRVFPYSMLHKKCKCFPSNKYGHLTMKKKV
jgi:hypothetical protein